MKTGFFEEAPGEKSATRLVFVVGSIWAMLITSYVVVVAHSDLMAVAGMFAALFAPVAALKVVQKPFESKPDEEVKQ